MLNGAHNALNKHNLTTISILEERESFSESMDKETVK